MIINIHAGHNPAGKIASGASGYLDESTENRNVVKEVKKILKGLGHTVYDCTCNNGKSQKDILQKIIVKCNKHTVTLDVSIHFNSYNHEKSADGKTMGCEVIVRNENSKSKVAAKRICDYINRLGFKNRGVKYSTNLYVLNHTVAPALLVECCFVDDADDAKLYNKYRMAIAIASGIVGKDLFKATTEKKLKLRSTWKKGYKTILKMPKGSEVEVLRIGSKFSKVKYGSYTGWCLNKYLKR